jgi:mono/diheme cytochrome c family protein
MKLIAATIVLILLTTGAGFAADAAAGKELYAKKCASCHGAGGEGKDAIAKMMKVELKHLGSKEVQSKSDADLAKTMTAGVGKMKPVADLKEKDAQDVVAFLRTLAKK